MKKILLIVLAAALVALPSCKNQKKAAAEAEAPQKELTQKEKYVLEELQLNAEELANSLSQLKTPKFFTVEEDGTVFLSEKEKMVKPDYFLDPAVAESFVTLEQKYRGLSMLSVDAAFAELYDMPVDGYEAAISKIVTEISDPGFEQFQKDHSTDYGAAYKTWYETEVNDGRVALFWNQETAFLVEQIYIVTRNIDKFMQLFSDEAASDISYHFLLVHEGLTQVVDIYPEMAPLNAALEPLYVINAINAEQLRDQLLELKGEIEAVRAFLLQ